MASEMLLPPLILELRARAGQLYSELGKVDAAARKTAAETEKSGSKMGNSWHKLQGVGKTATLGLVGGAIAVGVESIKMASHFQASMTLLQTAGGETAGNMKTVSNGILGLARSTGTSTEQLAEGMYTIEKAGIRGADGLLVLKAAAQGAKAENVDLGTATNALTSVMMSYHLKAKDAVSVQNQLIAGSGMAKTSMQEYAGSLSTVIPVASAAGINFAQVAGAIATLTQHGTSASEATQELANTIRSLQAPNGVASKALQQLGINVTDLSSNLGKRGLTGTIDLVTEAIQRHMGPAGLVVVSAFKKSQSASADARAELSRLPASMQTLAKSYLDGSITQTKWRSSLKGMGVEQRQLGMQFAATVNQSRGFNDMLKAGNPSARTFAGTLNQVMGGATGMNTALMLGGDNMKYFKTATDSVAKAGQNAGSNISTWAKTQANFSVQFDKFKQTISTTAIVIGTWLIPKVQMLFGFLSKHIGVVIALAAVIGGALVVSMLAWIGSLVVGAAKSVISFAKMMASGVRWAAVNGANFASAVVEYASLTLAGETWLATQIQQFAASIAAGASWAVEHTVMAATFIAENVAMAASATMAFIAENAATLGIVAGIALLVAGIVWVATHWKQAWHAITDVLKAAWTGVIRPVFDFIKQHWGLLFALLTGGLSLLAQHWRDVWGVVQTVYNAVIAPVFDFIKQHWGLMFAVVTGGLSLLIQHWRDVWGMVKSVYTSVILPVFHAIEVASKAVGSGLKWAYDHTIKPVWDLFATAFGGIKKGWDALWSGLGTVGTGVMSAIKDVVNGVIYAINMGVSAVDGVIHGINGMSHALSDLWTWIPGLGGTGIPAIPDIPQVPYFMDGGWVPGAVSRGMAAVVHGQEYVLSHKMLTGRAPIDPSVAAMVASGASAHAVGGRSSGAGAGGGAPVLENHTHVYIDGKQIQHAVERKQLQAGLRRGGARTYQGFSK